jgi:hypothetical protein
MLFLKIYAAFSLLTFLVVVMQSYVLYKEIKREYPDAVEEYFKNHKRNILERMFAWVRVLIACFVPIINIGIFYVAMFEMEKVKDVFISKELKL